MSNLKFYKSPFHITHDEEIADKMTEEVYAEMVQDKKLILLSLSTEEEVIYGIDWLSQLEGKDEQGDSHKQLDLFE